MVAMELLTHSRMATAKTCLKKHYFAYELGIRPEGYESKPLRIGTAVHIGLDMHAQGHDWSAIANAVQREYAGPPACGDTVEWEVECVTVLRLLHGYFWRWENDGIEVVATEQEFKLPLVNPTTGHKSTTAMVAGKIDKIIRLPDGRLAIMEHKTTSDSLDTGSDYWARLRLDQQISLYMLAARALGHDVQTVLYDVIRKPSIAPKIVDRKTGRRESPEEFGDRLTTDLGTRPDFYFGRREIPRLEADLTEFQAELWDQHKTLSTCRKYGRWYRNTNACLHPYRCDYFELCSNGIDASETVPLGFVKLTNCHPELSLVSV